MNTESALEKHADKVLWTQLEGFETWEQTTLRSFYLDNEEQLENLGLVSMLLDAARNGGTVEIGPYLVTTEEP